MFHRLINVNYSESLFIFGPRGSGKTTWIRNHFSQFNPLWIDLLNDEDEDRFGRHPSEISAVLEQTPSEWVVIDEVQKAPKLLDQVHLEIEKKRSRFVLSGSSARKLRRSGANLLAGRALTNHLFPLCQKELGQTFRLNDALMFGTLPKIFELSSPTSRNEFLRSYAQTYLKEEIVAEQIVRNVAPFRDFLQIAAQSNGEIINFSKIAHQIGIDDKTVQSYYQILEDTLLGFYLNPYHRSVRKRQRESPKFYLFDPGVKRSLERTLRVELLPQTSAYGKAFEHWIVLEVYRLNEYLRLDYEMMYIRTKDDAEIDLILERPGSSTLLIEIKSKAHVEEGDARHLIPFQRDWAIPCEAQIWSLDPVSKRFGNVVALNWEKALEDFIARS